MFAAKMGYENLFVYIEGMPVWEEFNYLWVTLIAGLGGVLGVLFTIPLRRALIIEAKLKFPEGVATA